MDLSNLPSLLIEQASNTISSMENLKRRAGKKDKERSDLYQKFRANEHSFRVYTYINAEIGQSESVKMFLKNVELFGEDFAGVDTEINTEVDKKAVQQRYEEVLTSFNQMKQHLA